MLVSCLAYSSTLNVEATCSSETSDDSDYTHYIPEDRSFHKHCCKNAKSYTYHGVHHLFWSWNSAVDIETDYGLDSRGVGVRILVGTRVFSSSRSPDWFWGPPSLLSSD
jgi:hypothetical protein